MAGARKGVRLLDFDGLYGDDPFSTPRRGKVVDVFKGLSEKGGRRLRKAGSTASFMRAAGGSPEAVVKLASWGSGAASARDQLDYISREGELELEMSDGTTLETREEIRDLVNEWSDRFSHRRDGKARNTVHFVLSTPPETDREATLEAARDWAQETFGEKHEYALVAHNDTEHPHVHIVAEVKGRDRSRFTVGPSDFHDMRERFAEKCRDRGIEMNATRRDVRGAVRGESMALRKMREEGRIPRIDGIAQLALISRMRGHIRLRRRARNGFGMSLVNIVRWRIGCRWAILRFWMTRGRGRLLPLRLCAFWPVIWSVAAIPPVQTVFTGPREWSGRLRLLELVQSSL